MKTHQFTVPAPEPATLMYMGAAIEDVSTSCASMLEMQGAFRVPLRLPFLLLGTSLDATVLRD